MNAFDPVERPAHYLTGRIEVMEFILDQKLDYLLGNVVAYVARAAHKGDELTDLKKARHCLDRRIRLLEESKSDPIFFRPCLTFTRSRIGAGCMDCGRPEGAHVR